MKDYKKPLIAGPTLIWALAFAYFFGQLLWSTLPFQWPFNVIVGYIGGLIAGLLLAYLVLGMVKSLVSRAVVASLILLFVGVVSASILRLNADTRVMSREIQELRDDAARKNTQ